MSRDEKKPGSFFTGSAPPDPVRSRHFSLCRPKTVTKVCRSCGKRKPLEHFPRRSDSRDGRHSWCYKCRAEDQRERRRALVPPEDDDERAKAWRERVLARHEAANEIRRKLGYPETPPPDVEPGWLERLQARAEAKAHGDTAR